MRIAIASTGLGHVARGIEAWARDLAYALHDRGVAVRLYKGGGEVESEIETVVPCVRRRSLVARSLSGKMATRLLWRFGLGGGYAIEQSTFARNLIPLLERDEIDLLHVQDPQLALVVQRAHQRGRTKTKVILGHGTEEPNEFLEKIEHLQHLAPWRLEQARAEGCYQPTWTAIPNFIDTEKFCPDGPDLREELGLPASAFVVLCTAAIKRGHKRIDYLIDEFARVLKKFEDQSPFLIVAGGREKQTDELIAYGKAMLGEQVRFLVNFPRQRMPDLYRTADLFTLASLNEMMPIALIEAAASGLPCLTHRHPVMQWMTGGGGDSADLVEPGALAEMIDPLVEDHSTRRTLSAAAREHAVAAFSTACVVDQIIRYYGTVLGETTPCCEPTPSSDGSISKPQTESLSAGNLH